MLCRAPHSKRPAHGRVLIPGRYVGAESARLEAEIRANLRSIVYHVGEEDRAVAELHDQLVKDKRGEILRIASRHGARDVRVFGSVSRGEADLESDVDFLVELEAGRSLLDLGGLQMELESLLGCRVDVVTVRGLKARIRERVLREAMPV